MKPWGSVLGHAFLIAAMGVVPVACGGSQKDANAELKQKNEERARRSLDRARETNDPDRFRRIISRFPNTGAASEARDDLAKIMVAKAQKALAAEDFVTAEDNALEAKQYGGVEMTLQATKVLDTIDDTRAAKIAEDATAKAAEGKCASGLKIVAATIRKKPRPRYKAAVQKESQTALVACLEKKLAGAVAEGNIEQARMMIETPDATTAFSNEGYKKAHEILEKAVVKKSTGSIDPLLAAKKWTEAIAKLDELRAKDELNPRERELAFGFVQDAIHKHLMATLQKAMSAKNPKEIAEDVDKQIKIAKWKAVPDDLQEARTLLGVNIECQKLGCKLQDNATNLWAWGKVPIHPPTNSEGGKRASIKHAQKVWVLGKSKNWALVTRKDPGKVRGEELLKKADGWSPTENLKGSDTDEWLPPLPQMKGVMVWGPLLEKDKKEYILGTVQKVDGKKLTVKRLTDGLETEVDWKKVHLGQLPKGLKVYAFCEDQIHRTTAKVEKIVTRKGGVPKVKVKCDKGKIERVEIASALTTRAAWLPRRRP